LLLVSFPIFNKKKTLKRNCRSIQSRIQKLYVKTYNTESFSNMRPALRYFFIKVENKNMATTQNISYIDYSIRQPRARWLLA